MRAVPAVAMVVLGACAVGPGYRPAPVVPEGTKVGVSLGTDSARAFFDSLRAARAVDTVATLTPPPAPRRLATESLARLAWVDILHDTVLSGLINAALRQNRDLAVAQGRIREYRALSGIAASALYPSLSLDGSVGKNQIKIGALPLVTYNAWILTANVSWELDVWGGIRRGLQAAAADADAQAAAADATVLAIVSDVATGYLEVLELDDERATAERTLASRRATLGLAQERYAHGVISELDVRQFEAQVGVPAARLAQVEQAEAAVEHALSVLLGEPPGIVPRGLSLEQAARVVVVPDSIPSSLLERRPDVREAERAYAAATARIGVADATRLPEFTITGLYGSQALTAGAAFTPQSDIYQIQAGVSIPIFTGGRLVNTIRAARARADEARAAYEEVALTALGEAADALAAVRAARDAVAAQDTQVRALRQAFNLAQARYAAGVASYLEVLDAERSLFDAEIAISEARLQQLTAAVQLYKALGGAWVKAPTPGS